MVWNATTEWLPPKAGLAVIQESGGKRRYEGMNPLPFYLDRIYSYGSNSSFVQSHRVDQRAPEIMESAKAEGTFSIPLIAQELRSPQFALWGSTDSSSEYIPKLIGYPGVVLGKLAKSADFQAKAENLPYFLSNLSLANLLSWGGQTEKLLLAFLRKAYRIESMLYPYTEQQEVKDNTYYSGMFGPYLKPSIIANFIAKKQVAKLPSSLSELLGAVAGKTPGLYQKAVQSVIELREVWKTAETALASNVDCLSLPADLRAIIDHIAKLEVLADAALAEAETANKLADLQTAAANSAEDTSEKLTELTNQKKALDKKLEELQTKLKSGKLTDEEYHAIEAEIAKLEAEKIKLTDARVFAMENLNEFGRSNGRTADERSNRNDLSKEATGIVEELTHFTGTFEFSMPKEGGGTKKITVKVKPSESAQSKIEQAKKIQEEAQVKSEAASKKTQEALVTGIENLKYGGTSSYTTSEDAAFQDIIPWVNEHVPEDKKKEAGFPWWLLALAGGLGVTGAVPVAAAAGIGALALLIGKKDE